MSYSELYYDFFEGNLDAEQEQEFFELLRSDETFRSGMKSFVNVTGTINKNIKLFGPSTLETSELYSMLGFTIPTVPVPLPPVSVPKLPFYQNQFFKFFLTGVASSLLTFMFFYFMWSPADKSKSSYPITSNKEVTSSVITESKNTENGNKNAIVTKTEQGNKSISQNKLSKRNIILSPQKIDESHVLGQVESIKNDNYANQIITKSKFNSIDVRNFNNQINSFSEQKPQLIYILTNQSLQKLGISFEIRNSINWNLPNETITPYKYSKFNGLGISVLYEVSDNYKIGFDLRQETFFVNYNTQDSYQRINFEQQPNLTSYGILFELTPDLEFLKLKPDMLINISGNYYGLILRGGLGLEYDFGNNLSGIIRTEYSKMYFKHDLNWFQANKFSINYGIKYHF